MDLREIIKFAIEKEEEAIKFYDDLSEKTDSESLKKELKRISAMEAGHKKRLQNLDLKTYIKGGRKIAEDLKIADYTLEMDPAGDMSFRRLLNIAMHRELKAMELYNDLSKIFPEPAKTMFKNLAADESQHKHIFETIWDDEMMKEN